jgi:hypothetical protein
MTRTPPSKDLFLSNNTREVFKSNTKQKTELVKTSDGLFNCNLNLPDGSSITIPMREDGYINATILCKAGGKEFKHWFENKTTKLLIYTSESEVGIPTSQLIDIKKGNSSKFEQGSWIHPDLGIHLAQWISPSFALQVSRWTRELLLFGKVELGQEKSNKELENKFQEQIKLLTQEKQQAIEQVIIEKDTIARRFTSLTQNHNKRRRRGVYEIGNVVYIISHVAFTRQLQSKVLYLYNINTKLK